MRLERMTGVLVLSAGVVLGSVLAAEPVPITGDKTAPKDADPVLILPTDAKMPNAPKALPKPGKPAEVSVEHKLLTGFVGHWKTTVHVMSPDANSPVQDTQGTADGTLAMGGRFAELTHTGVLNGQPFEAKLFCGFDDVFNKYTALWLDTTSPAMITYIGTYVSSKQQFTMTAHYSEQGTRRLTIARIVITFVDSNTSSSTNTCRMPPAVRKRTP